MVTLGGPRIDEEAVVEAVDDQAGGVAQHHAAGGGREGGAAEPLVGRRSPLIARGRDRGVAHDRVDRVVLRQRAVERDAGAERQDGLVARVGNGRRRLEADARSASAEGHVGRMVELQRAAVEAVPERPLRG